MKKPQGARSTRVRRIKNFASLPLLLRLFRGASQSRVGEAAPAKPTNVPAAVFVHTLRDVDETTTLLLSVTDLSTGRKAMLITAEARCHQKAFVCNHIARRGNGDCVEVACLSERDGVP